MKNTYLFKLNKAQYEAVNKIDGPMIIIAGAGSGKTRVLTSRIAYLIKQNINDFNILSLTFTNKAAKEMRKRITEILGEVKNRNLLMGTFHSVFSQLLRIEGKLLGYPKNYTIYDQQDSKNVIKKIIEKMQLDKNIYNINQVLSKISQYKNNLITIENYQKNLKLQKKDNISMFPRIGEIYHTYVSYCFKIGAMDFDDLLLNTNKILTKFPEILKKYQERFKYILIDEYQDINNLQYLIIKLLAERYKNICVVGDDAQSIYSFRGANINNILNFQKDYPNMQIFRLEQNYRSTYHIVQAANSLIAYNKDQLKKKNWTDNDKGEKIKIYCAISDIEESFFVSNMIFKLKKEKSLDNKDFAILYRTNAQSRIIEEALHKKNIPYHIYGNISFYQNKEIKSFLSYLRFIVNPNDEEALLKIINYPVRGLGKVTINKLLFLSKKYNKNIYEILENLSYYYTQLQLSNKIFFILHDFKVKIQYLRLQLDNNAYIIAKETDKIFNLIQLFSNSTNKEAKYYYENIKEFLSSIKSYVEEQYQIKDGDPSLSSFLRNITLDLYEDKTDLKNNNKISLMTIHLSKGLEFPIVFIIGLEENLFPSILSINSQKDIEEERRLLYVALTRAEKQALISYAIARYHQGKLIKNKPSRFIKEIDQQYLDLDWYKNNKINYKKHESYQLNKIFYQKKEKKSIIIPNNNKIKFSQNILIKNNISSVHVTSFNLKNGMEIIHIRFGKGKIILIEGNGENQTALIQFYQVGIKKLLLRLANLKIV